MEFMSVFPMAEKQEIVQPEQLHFKDDGVYPGSVLPVLLYPAGITGDAQDYRVASPDFSVVGAYPDGREWDLLRGLPGERPQSDRTIAALPIPDYDPIYGADGPLRQIWKVRS